MCGKPTLTGDRRDTARRRAGFTLIEMISVIVILGIIAALAVPALKNLGQSNAQLSAARQLLDDVGQARQLAISQHTTVYMVFVPENFWSSLTPSPALTNLLDKQFTGYNYISLRSVGDQPGQYTARYLSDWKSLPDGAFIATNKFNTAYNYPGGGEPVGYNSYPIYDNSSTPPAVYPINSFNYTNTLPFPTQSSFPGIPLPYIAFNYLGQLTVDGLDLAPQDEYIPLAQGTVAYATDVNKTLQFQPPGAVESPPGNSTNSMFNVIHIDRLTGRAGLLQQKAQ